MVNGNIVIFIDEIFWIMYYILLGLFFYEGLDVIVGVVNLFDKELFRIFSSGFDLGNLVFYLQYDFIGCCVFVNLCYNF